MLSHFLITPSLVMALLGEGACSQSSVGLKRVSSELNHAHNPLQIISVAASMEQSTALININKAVKIREE